MRSREAEEGLVASGMATARAMTTRARRAPKAETCTDASSSQADQPQPETTTKQRSFTTRKRSIMGGGRSGSINPTPVGGLSPFVEEEEEAIATQGNVNKTTWDDLGGPEGDAKAMNYRTMKRENEKVERATTNTRPLHGTSKPCLHCGPSASA